VLRREPSKNVTVVLTALRRSLLERIGPSADHLPAGGIRRKQRLRAIAFESAAEALDGATVHSWFTNRGDPVQLESTLFDLLDSRLVEDPVEPSLPTVAAPQSSDTARPAGVSDAMWDIIRAAQLSAQAAPEPQPARARDILRRALNAEIREYCLLVSTSGKAWQTSCGPIFAQNKARGTHWPRLKATFPLLAVCAWLILPAMNANVITERANSIGRLVLSHLRGHARAEDTTRLVLAYYSRRASKKAKQRRADLHRDLLLLQGGGGDSGAGSGGAAAGPGGAVAVDEADDDLPLPADELEEELVDAALKEEGSAADVVLM